MSAVIGVDARAVESTPNGLGTYARKLVQALARIDTKNQYIVIRRPDSGAPIAVGPNVREVCMSGDPSTPSLGRGISRLGLDLFHSLHHFLPVGLRVPRVVLTLHDLIWLEHRRLIRNGPFAPFTRIVTHTYARAAMRHAIHRADYVIAISRFSRSRALAYFGIDPSRIGVVYHGVEHAEFRPASESVEPANRSAYFLCLGNSRPYKNLPTALKAFALCARNHPDTALVVTGRGDSTAELRRLARELGVDARVTFTGAVDHDRLLDLLRGARALVLPSLIEGFGLPMLEAMAAGCPVVASTCPTLVEIGADAALFCDPHRPEDFSAAMARLLGDAALRADLRHRGFDRAAQFSWTECAQRTLAVYESLLAPAATACGAAMQ